MNCCNQRLDTSYSTVIFGPFLRVQQPLLQRMSLSLTVLKVWVLRETAFKTATAAYVIVGVSFSRQES